MHSFHLPRALVLVLACAGALTVQAQTLPADAPAGTTVQCKDGSYASPASKSGACRGHKGIQNWYGAPAAAAPAAAPAPAAPAAVAPAKPTAAAPAAPAPAPAAPAPAKANGAAAAPAAAAAPGGGPGQVWANTSTKVYHCPGDRYYGKTKKGEYMSEADAKAKGIHGANNKACS